MLVINQRHMLIGRLKLRYETIWKALLCIWTDKQRYLSLTGRTAEMMVGFCTCPLCVLRMQWKHQLQHLQQQQPDYETLLTTFQPVTAKVLSQLKHMNAISEFC